MRILVTGSTEWANPLLIRMALAAAGPATIVHPAITGAAAVAAAVAASFGWPVEAHAADRSLGGRAEQRRNQAMVDRGASLCLVFLLLGSRDAGDLVRRCRKAVIPVRIPATTWQLERNRELVALAVFAGAVMEATPSMRWTVGRSWVQLQPQLLADGWRGRPIGLKLGA